MSRPRRIHDRRASSRRTPVDSATAVARPPASPGGSRTTRSVSARRASAASRPSRSAIRAGRSAARQPATGQVEDEEVDRAPGEQRATDRQALVERLRGDDHEPFEPDAPGDGLDRVEAARQVEPGHDRAGRLGLGGEPEDERGPAARAVAADRDAGRPRQAAGSQDRVERGKAGRDDAIVRARRVGRDRGGCRCRLGRQGQRAVRSPSPRSRRSRGDLRSCRSPASLEARHGCRHVRGEGRHRTLKIEHLFDGIKARRCTTVVTGSSRRPPTLAPLPCSRCRTRPRRSPSDRSWSSTTTPRSSAWCGRTSSATGSRSSAPRTARPRSMPSSDTGRRSSSST